MATTPIPMPQQPQTVDPGTVTEYMRQIAAQQANTTGLTQMAPNMGGATPPAQRQFKDPGQQQTSAFGVGEKGAHQRESMQNLVKASQSLANQFGQYAQEKQNREYQQTITRFTGATQGVGQAQAQILQATQALKQNPQDAAAQAQLQAAQGALKQNQAILNDMANDKKAHKIITKAFGIDDKNANSPERAAAIKAIRDQSRPQQQQTTGAFPGYEGRNLTVQGPPSLSQGAAQMQSGIPQTQQLSPQAQQQQQARQAGVVGAPATQGQVLSAYSKLYDNGIKNGLTQEKLDIEMNKRGLTFKTDDSGNRLYNDDGTPQLRPMTEEEVNQNPITRAQLDYKAAQTAAQKAAADAKTDPNNPELQIKASEAAARMLSARASMMRAQKYVPGGGSGSSGAGGMDLKALAQQMLDGKIAPSELPGFGKVRAQVFAEAQKIDPKFSPALADVQYKFANNPRVQQQLSLINSLAGYGDTKGSLDEVINQSSKIKRTSFPPVNSVEMQALIAGGDQEAAAYAAVATDVADQIGQIMTAGGAGGSSDFKLRQAQAVLSGKFSPKQLAATARELRTLLNNRQKAFIAQGGPFLKQQMDATDTTGGAVAPAADSNDPLGILK